MLPLFVPARGAGCDAVTQVPNRRLRGFGDDEHGWQNRTAGSFWHCRALARLFQWVAQIEPNQRVAKLTEATVTELTACEINGERVRRFALENASDLRVELMEFGATLVEVAWLTPDAGKVTLSRGLQQASDYSTNTAYMGSICGRYAGRIAQARFRLGDKKIELSRNNGQHHLHGGHQGFDGKLWRAQPFAGEEEAGVEFTYTSPAGEEGYPGRLDCVVRYSLDDNNRLRIGFGATTDTATVVNLTNHSYWNLSNQPDVLGHHLQINAARALEFDADLLPSGKFLATRGTALDFEQPAELQRQMTRLPPTADGLDHCFVIDSNVQKPLNGLPRVATLTDPQSQRHMHVYSDQPALIVYTGNHLDGTQAHGGHCAHAGIALECQQFPDAPNQPGFPDVTLLPGDHYRQSTVYEFG